MWLGLAGVALVLTGLTACANNSSPAGERPVTTAAPLPTPLSTSVDTAQGTWATVPMGHLDDPLNTFWQLFFLPIGGTSWSDQVQATAVATNGGLVLAPAGARSLAVGVRPSNQLTFSPIVATANGGHSWANSLIPQGLAANPDALAAGPSGQAAALVNNHVETQVLTSTGDLSNWQLLATQVALASSPGGRACSVLSLAAVAYQAEQAVVAASCARPGVVGLLTQDAAGWQLVGPALPASLSGDSVQVLALRSTTSGLVTLLALSGATGKVLAAAWSNAITRTWSLSPPLGLAPAEQVTSFGPAPGGGLFVLQSGPPGEQLDVIAGPDTAWRPVASPPRGTATVAFTSPTTVDALVVDSTVLSVWTLPSGAAGWVRGQVLDVPIQYGSSS